MKRVEITRRFTVTDGYGDREQVSLIDWPDGIDTIDTCDLVQYLALQESVTSVRVLDEEPAGQANVGAPEEIRAMDPLTFRGISPATYIKLAYGLGANLDGPGRFDLNDPLQRELRRIRDWITMAEHDALESRRA
jgi:hypothetical protein